MTVLELPTVDTAAQAAVPAPRGRVLRRLARNPLAVGGFVVVLLAVVAAVFASVVAPYPYAQTDFAAALNPPSGAHWFGTDELGRDQFSRVVYGLRVSVTVGALAVALSMVVGVPFGLLAGFYRILDPLVSRLTDTLLAFPFLVLAVGLFAILEQSELGRTASIATPIIAIGVAQIPAVVGEAVLSFLGLGVKPPTPSLGVMLASAQPLFRDGPWMAVFPGVSIVLLTLALNLLGDGMRDALDPKESRR